MSAIRRLGPCTALAHGLYWQLMNRTADSAAALFRERVCVCVCVCVCAGVRLRHTSMMCYVSVKKRFFLGKEHGA